MKLSRIPKRLAHVAYSCISPARQAPQGQPPAAPPPPKRSWERPGPDNRKLRGRALMKKRQQIALRDKYTCQCGCKRITTTGELDHRIPLHKGGTDEDGNLQWMTVECHAKKTAAERGYQ